MGVGEAENPYALPDQTGFPDDARLPDEVAWFRHGPAPSEQIVLSTGAKRQAATTELRNHLFPASGYLHSAVMQTTEPSDMDMTIRFGPAIMPSKTGIVLRSYSAVRFPDSES